MEKKLNSSCFSVAGRVQTEDCFQSGECIESFQVDAETVSDEFECLDLCNSNDNCHWFTFFPRLKFCELLSNCSALDAERCPTCLSGEKGIFTSTMKLI
jgi:hypothetical protein